MAKGRKLSLSRSERLLGSYTNSHERFAGGGESELGEDDVRLTVDDDMVNEGGEWSPRTGSESNGSINGFRSRRRLVPTEHHLLQVGGLSSAFDDSDETAPSSPSTQDSVNAPMNGQHLASSAPLNVPDWTKNRRINSIESYYDSDFNGQDDNYEMVPPHVYLAREYARMEKIPANSMFEGIGRTLKGRDMSRVRDAVWSQTGFNG